VIFTCLPTHPSSPPIHARRAHFGPHAQRTAYGGGGGDGGDGKQVGLLE
jgi:hypothetical protein